MRCARCHVASPRADGLRLGRGDEPRWKRRKPRRKKNWESWKKLGTKLVVCIVLVFCVFFFKQKKCFLYIFCVLFKVWGCFCFFNHVLSSTGVGSFAKRGRVRLVSLGFATTRTPKKTNNTS